MSFDADPLFNERNAFYKGVFQTIENAASKPGAESLALRSRVEVDAAKAVRELKGDKKELSQAAYALALHKTGKTTESLKIADQLLTSSDPDIQIIIATVLAREPDRIDDAIDILNSIEDSLEAVALLIQIYLSTDQLTQAQSTLKAAKGWAQDAELIQLAESWVSLRAGGTENYQSAFYTAQEFADTAGSPVRMLLAQAVAEIELGNYEEAEGTMVQVLSKDPENADALANSIVLKTLLGKDATAERENLAKVSPQHPMVLELQEKVNEFDSLKTSYTFVEA